MSPAPPVHPRLAGRRLYLCTPDRADVVRFVAECIGGGVDVVQLREKHLDDRALLSKARLVAEVCADYGVPFILNDRPDLALEVGAAGVHVGQQDAPPGLCRRILGPEAVIGLSTHERLQMLGAAEEPVDYISAGPVEATPTKPGRPGVGLGYLREVAGAGRWPWFVTGGVTPRTVPAMVEAGAERFVVVRWLTESSDPRASSRLLADAIARALEGLPAG